jgi:tellurite resistance protein TerC
MNLFQYLKIGLSVILTFVGIKMVIADIYPIPITVALGIVAGVLLLSIVASILWPKREAGRSRPPTR